jgi:hypothetical protein
MGVDVARRLALSVARVAVTSLRAATDLLATHQDRDGVARTSEAVLLDERAMRAVGLAGIGDLAASVLASARDLGLRAGQAGDGMEAGLTCCYKI